MVIIKDNKENISIKNDSNDSINIKNDSIDDEINSLNIFEEFIKEESSTNNIIQEKKDQIFYLEKVGHFIQNIFIFILILILPISYLYIYIQNNENIRNSQVLDIFCPIFSNNIEFIEGDSFCSSIYVLKSYYENELSDIRSTYSKEILNIIDKLYRVENFSKTKDVVFLLDKSNNKLKVLKILEEFDNLKNRFSLQKAQIRCDSLDINGRKKILSMNCSAYSNGFENKLRGFDSTYNNTLGGTSISIANSFLNFIEKQSDIFAILNRHKIFSSDFVFSGNDGLTHKTDFKLILQYNIK